MNIQLKTPFAVCLGLCGLTCGAIRAEAQGLLFPRDHAVRIQPFYVKNLHINTVIRDAVAETTVEQTFVNSSSVEQEANYLYPLPEGAMPTAFSMTVGDKTMEPRILTHDEARRTYEGIVRSRRDPALLEYVGRNLVQINVFPIPAQGERVIKLRYTEILKPENGVRKWTYASSTARFGARPVGTATARIEIKTTAPLKNIYSPTHDLDIRRPDDHTAVASWESANDTSDRDLTLYYGTNADDVGLSLLTYRSGERDGYFMLLASPRVDIPKNRILPKQVVFVLDRTGSMQGEKIKQARKSLLYCLDSLKPQDRFDVITFSEAPDTFTRTLEPATEANVRKARDFVTNIEASGGTNIEEALHTALNLLGKEDGTQKMVVFLTDGLPTIGETNVETIVQHVRIWNDGKTDAAKLEDNGVRPAAFGEKRKTGSSARIFCFGLGYDVNVPFLDKLADVGRGDADYVKPQEDVEAKVSNFFSKVTSPVLADVRLAVEGADIYDVYPKTYPDLFKGSQLIITGRFRNAGSGTVRLTGMANGAQATFKEAANFGEADGRNTYLPRIWAARKIGYLVDQLRLADRPDANREVIDEIVNLSRDYGIITEYTSFLVDEREQARLGLNNFSVNGPLPGSVRDTLRKEVGRRAMMNGSGGAGATDQSLRSKDLQSADKVSSRYQANSGGVYMRGQNPNGSLEKSAPAAGNYAYRNYGLGSGRYGSQKDIRKPIDTFEIAGEAGRILVQAVADKTFYLQNNSVWQDQSYDDKKQKTVEIQAYSAAHFALLKAVPHLAAYSSVGEEVIVRIGSSAVHIGKNGKEKLTEAELHTLLTK